MAPLDAGRWATQRSFHHSDFPPERLAAAKRERVSVVLPARECADTVAALVEPILALQRAGVVDEVVVLDAASSDGTAEVARRAGARVVQEAELDPELGPVLGKGDAMWRSLGAVDGEVICFVDADGRGPSAHFVPALIGPLILDPAVQFVKGHYHRPLAVGELRLDGGGGRVNHLTARPALALFYPELAEVRQPLAGEVAVRRGLLERVPFVTGYGVEIAMLIDAYKLVGLGGLAQVDLDEHLNSHQSLQALTPMATTVLATIAERLRREGRLQIAPAGPVERPPRSGR
jgi:glucosyl-3-phosphoglycerate synthase